MIAILGPSTTRSVKHPHVNNLALFRILLPSVVRTVECGYRYVFFLGYDIGDQFYDTPQVGSSITHYF